MRNWRSRLLEHAQRGPVVMVTVIATEGSTPREVGARMIVHGGGQEGSIGGGLLEFQETAAAQALLHSKSGSWHREVRRIVLGPDAGQCCGGVVEVLHEVIARPEAAALAALPDNGILARIVNAATPFASCADHGGPDFNVVLSGSARQFIERIAPRATPLYLYGAGHVARAVVRVLNGLPFAITWIDVDRARFPTNISAAIDAVVSTSPREFASTAPASSLHLVMTHSHDLDYAICSTLLARDDLTFVGLIGSATKRARFVQRFKRDGIDDVARKRLVCPIGLAGIPGKSPDVIAIAVAAQLLSRQPSELQASVS